MSVTSFIGAITGGNNIKLEIRINPPATDDPTKAVLIDHYPSWRLHKNPFWRVKHPTGNIGSGSNENTQITTNWNQQQQQQQQQYPSPNNPYGVPSPDYNNNPYGGQITDPLIVASQQQQSKELLYVFDGSQDVEGVVIIRLQQSTAMTKGQDHMGIRIQFIGRIDTGVGGIATSVGTDGKPRYDFISLNKELLGPGTLYQYETVLPFKFKNTEKEFDSYNGRNVAVRYILKVTMERKFLPPLKTEKDLWVQLVSPEPVIHEPIKMEVGIEDCLHIEFEYDRKIYHLQDTIRGKIHFLLVRIKIKQMELAVIRRETSGDGVAAAAAANIAAAGSNAQHQQHILGPRPPIDPNASNSNTNIYTETQTLVKYEIMDGAPVKGEVIPVKLSLKGIPADLTPTYTPELNHRFSVKYFLNLVLVDEDDRRYFKQQEIILYRNQLG